MSTILEVLRKGKSKTTAVVAIVAAAIVIPASLYAWGPTRTTYTIEQPAEHVTFNSITNNPNIGDERNFVGIREASAPNLWHDEMNVEPGKEYIVRMYVHNNAADNLNLVAENTKALVTLPTATGRSVQVDGAVTASNATPGTVYDHATFVGEQDFNIAYVPGTLKYETNKGTFDIPETVFDQRGALLGYDKMDGKVPGCFEYAGYLSFRVKPQFAPTNKFETQKQVRKSGETAWHKSIAANPGDEVEYQITYKNSGETRQNNVVLRDTLPQGINYVPGSTYLKNTVHTTPTKVSDNLTKPEGINIGDYQPNSVAYVKFNAKVATKDELECGAKTLTNKIRTTVDGGYIEDTADVTVDIECEPPVPEPGKIVVCELETNKVITIREDEFDENRHTTDLSKCDTPEVPVTPTTPVTPVTPTELPKTGVSNGTVTMAGLALVALIAGYAVTARRTLG